VYAKLKSAKSRLIWIFKTKVKVNWKHRQGWERRQNARRQEHEDQIVVKVDDETEAYFRTSNAKKITFTWQKPMPLRCFLQQQIFSGSANAETFHMTKTSFENLFYDNISK